MTRFNSLLGPNTYADIGPRVAQKSGFSPTAGALRGFGMPQLVWAYESHTDLVARELGLDPVEFRRKNLLKDGLPQATGTVLKDTATVAVLDRVVQRIGWGQPFDRGRGSLRRGRGVAIGLKASISPTTKEILAEQDENGDSH